MRDHVNGMVRPFRDDFITQIDANTGEIIFDRSVSDILIDNGYKNFVYGFTNRIKSAGTDWDPLHLNDVQPVTADSEYWQQGDLLISLRHRSLVFLYRPETNEIKRLIYGPFLNQHDVDIISPSKGPCEQVCRSSN